MVATPERLAALAASVAAEELAKRQVPSDCMVPDSATVVRSGMFSP
ncbi:hypothetical protein [Kitasatospora sp. NPDC087271]